MLIRLSWIAVRIVLDGVGSMRTKMILCESERDDRLVLGKSHPYTHKSINLTESTLTNSVDYCCSAVWTKRCRRLDRTVNLSHSDVNFVAFANIVVVIGTVASVALPATAVFDAMVVVCDRRC